ncbi:MAG: G5 domain-containing protein [Clostridia bacterium]|nr:G5 domain-containing protein [Clostridia bacterium]
MKFNCKESAKKVFDKIGTALRATKKFTVKYSRSILASALAVATMIAIGGFSFSVKKFNIFDGKTYKTVSIIGGNFEKALLRANLTDDYEIVSKKETGNTTDIVIKYTFPVTVKTGKEEFVLQTSSTTVSKILGFVGIKMDKDDIVKPSADTFIEKKSTIEFFDVEFVSGTYNEPIPYDTTTIYTDTLAKGSKKSVAGTNGEQKIYYTEKRINGEVVETFINNKEIITTAVSGQNIVGTATPKASAVTTSANTKTISTLIPSAPIALDANGNPVNYKSKKVVQATAYTYTGHRCSTGVNPQPGYIAVNPSIIPYGTKMYIKSCDGRYIYGYAVAADTGGFIKSRPTNVDLFFATNSACNAFGRRNVEIYILE